MSRLQHAWVPWVTLGAALLLAPAYGWMATVATRREYDDHPPSCTGIGFGCELSPGGMGWLTAIVYIGAVVLVGVAIALLHYGGSRLALARAVVAFVAVSLLWLLALIGTVWAYA